MSALQYPDNLKVKDALPVYFSKYHFKDGGYNLKWFKIKLGRIYIPFPNIKARVDAVKMHDIHHLVTEYKADYRGEAEIGGWEIASGCGKYYMAWILNTGSFLLGMLFYQRALFNSFMNGRRCKTNLYCNTTYDELLLNKTVGELRNEIGIHSTEKNKANDYFYFALWCLITVAVETLLIVLACFFLKAVLHFIH